MHNADDIVVAKEFLNFMVDYYALTRRHTIETNEYRSNSHGFSMLYVLRNYQNQPITMSKFADEMGITKQQLSKLVNDLEERNTSSGFTIRKTDDKSIFPSRKRGWSIWRS